MNCIFQNDIFDLDCILPKDNDGLINSNFLLSHDGVLKLRKVLSHKNSSTHDINIYINENGTLDEKHTLLPIEQRREQLWKYIDTNKATAISFDITIKTKGKKEEKTDTDIAHMNNVVVFLISSGDEKKQYLSIRFEPHRHATFYCRDSVRKCIRYLFQKEEETTTTTTYSYLDNVLLPDRDTGLQQNENYQILRENMTNEKITISDLRKVRNDDKGRTLKNYDDENISPLKGIDGFCASWSSYASFILTCNKAVGLKKVADYLLHFGLDTKTNAARVIYEKHCKLYRFMLYNAFNNQSSLKELNFNEGDKKTLDRIFTQILPHNIVINHRLKSPDKLNLEGLTRFDLNRFDPHRCKDDLVEFSDFSPDGCTYTNDEKKKEVERICYDAINKKKPGETAEAHKERKLGIESHGFQELVNERKRQELLQNAVDQGKRYEAQRLAFLKQEEEKAKQEEETAKRDASEIKLLQAEYDRLKFKQYIQKHTTVLDLNKPEVDTVKKELLKQKEGTYVYRISNSSIEKKTVLTVKGPEKNVFDFIIWTTVDSNSGETSYLIYPRYKFDSLAELTLYYTDKKYGGDGNELTSISEPKKTFHLTQAYNFIPNSVGGRRRTRQRRKIRKTKMCKRKSHKRLRSQSRRQVQK
jgi:hypothetical protein